MFDIDLGFYVVSSVALKYILSYRSSAQKEGVPRNARKVGTVKTVYVYPFKSAAAEAVPEAECTEMGVQHRGVLDRQWMVMNSDNKGPVSGRDCPQLTTIKTRIEEGRIVLSCRDLPPLSLPTRLPKDNPVVPVDFYSDACEGIDCGDNAADWIKKAVQEPDAPYRLVFHDAGIKTRFCKDGILRDTFWREANPHSKVSYQDVISHSLVSTATMDDLNDRLAYKYGPSEYNIQPTQFRLNIVIEGVKRPYAEDDWLEVFIGEQAAFTVNMYCTRCKMTTINPETGKFDKRGEPLLTIHKYRPKLTFPVGPFGILTMPAFGMYFELSRAGTIKVGDPVYAVTW